LMASATTLPMLKTVLYGGSQLCAEDEVKQLVESLHALPPMDKDTMSGRCLAQTANMEKFMRQNLQMANIDRVFCQGVRAFTIGIDLQQEDPKKVIEFRDSESKSLDAFRVSVEEVRQWQSSYRCFVANDIYAGDAGKQLVRKSLMGQSDSGDEAWKMKFAIRISQNPIFLTFNGKVVNREVGDKTTNNIYLVSVCGMDFAGRKHDVMDVTRYIANWRKVYYLNNDLLAPVNGRDFMPTGVRAQLNVDVLTADLLKMARLRLRAQNVTGIQVVVETGLGLGVFSGDQIGIGPAVRALSARALRQVLEEDHAAHSQLAANGAASGFPPQYLHNIKLVALALPVFQKLDNYHYFVRVFEGKFLERE